MKKVFQADDGTIFDTQAECERHERDHSLYQFVAYHCPTEYNDDAGFRVIEVNGVVDFIEAHYEKIGELLGKKDSVEENDWIVNTQTYNAHPTKLHARDYIEVVDSNGNPTRSYASNWDQSWNISKDYHIVKYRKVTN